MSNVELVLVDDPSPPSDGRRTYGECAHRGRISQLGPQPVFTTQCAQCAAPLPPAEARSGPPCVGCGDNTEVRRQSKWGPYWCCANCGLPCGALTKRG